MAGILTASPFPMPQQPLLPVDPSTLDSFNFDIIEDYSEEGSVYNASESFADNISQSGSIDCSASLASMDVAMEHAMDLTESRTYTTLQTIPQGKLPRYVGLSSSSDVCPSEEGLVFPPDVEIPIIGKASTRPADDIRFTTFESSADSDPNDMTSWIRKHPESWEQKEVLDFIYSVAHEQKLPVEEINGERFNTVRGIDLCHYNLNKFKELEPKYGEIFYKSFKNILDKSHFEAPMVDELSTQMQSSCQLNSPPPVVPTSIQGTTFFSQQQCNALADLTICGKSWKVEYDPADKFEGVCTETQPTRDRYSSSGYDSESGHSELSTPAQSPGPVLPPASTRYPPATFPFNQHTCMSINTNDHNMISSTSCPPTKKNLKKPKHGEDEITRRRGRRTGQMSKGIHLWEFVRDLLLNPEHNPRIIKWEDAEEGVFRFVQSDQVAKLWGKKKNNPSMTYEKLSRAMRFCRTAHYFTSVPKEGKFPKKLVFKFGHKATGWHQT